jgi:hypothetical protein
VVCKSQYSLLYPLSIGDEVNFRLTYDGPLKAASQSENRRNEKHLIRQIFSRQLKELYDLRNADFLHRETNNFSDQLPHWRRGSYNCLALVREKLNLVCDLDILFLRRENPGQLIKSGGDIDNRLKVLFDALRMPQDDNEVRGFEPQPGNRALFCLTEDDKLITGFRVTTDRLLEPPQSPAEENNVQLIINVEVKATTLTEENMAYFAHF